jgi:hypothetical protein
MGPDPKSSFSPIRCELCGGPMKLVRSIPRFGAHPELATFECLQCHHVMTRPVEEEQR